MPFLLCIQHNIDNADDHFGQADVRRFTEDKVSVGRAKGCKCCIDHPDFSENHFEIEFDEKSDTRVQIEKFVDEKPDAVAQLLRNWLNEDWE